MNHDLKETQSIAAFGMWPSEYPTTGSFELAKGIFDAAAETLRRFRERATQLRASGRLTQIGMVQELTAYAAESLDNLDRAAAKHLPRARAELAELETKLRGVPGLTVDSGGRAAREAEVRTHLLQTDVARRMAILSDAIERGEEIVATAVFNAPKFIQEQILTPPELLEQARERWETVRSPEVASQVRRLRAALEMATRAVATAKREILASGDVDPKYSEALQFASLDLGTAA